MEGTRKPEFPNLRGVGIAAISGFLLAAFSGVTAGSAADPHADHEAGSTGGVEIPLGSGQIDEFLGCEHSDGSTQRIPVTPAEMPWRVAIDMPKSSPKYGSRRQARDAAIAAMRQWERAIRTRVPWFELAFVDRDDDAPIQIEWKRRITGKAAGRAGPVCRLEGESVRAGGRMDIAVRSCPTCRPLTVDEVTALVSHEFGHILGLGHCLDCDSAMNYSWHTRDRVFVTHTDVVAVAYLLGEGEASGAEAATSDRFVLEGHILAYDEARNLLEVRVTETDSGKFHQFTIGSFESGDRPPGGIERDSEQQFLVTPGGNVMKRTVIRTAAGGGLDTKGTAAGFRQALSKLRDDQLVLFTLERNDQPEGGDPVPGFRVSSILVYSTGEDLRER